MYCAGSLEVGNSRSRAFFCPLFMVRSLHSFVVIWSAISAPDSVCLSCDVHWWRCTEDLCFCASPGFVEVVVLQDVE